MSRGFDPLLIAGTGVQLIEASAGTGKTYSITSLYLRLLLERRLTVEQILVVTFTEAATAELHERIRTRLRTAAQGFQDQHGGADPFLCQLLARSTDHEADRRLLARAVSDIDKGAVSTIHGFAHRVLQQHALETGLLFELELTGATQLLVQEISDDYWSSFFYDLDHRLATLVRQGVSPAQLRSLTQEAIRHGDFAIVGEVSSEDELPGLMQEFCRLYSEVRDCWQEQREALAHYFAQAEGLTKPFKTLLDNGLLDRLADFFATDEPASFAPPRHTELLGGENIFQPDGKIFTATALKKGVVQSNPFFELWGRLLAQTEVMGASCQARFLAGAARSIRAELPKRLLAGQQQSFDELLTGLDRALRGVQGASLAQAIRSRFPVALIDEFQDTDPVQYRIFRTIYGHGGAEALFLIGDPKQAIYGFRGADIYAYLGAAGQAESEKHTMTTNWRADRGMVAALNALFGGLAHPFVDGRISYAQVEARPGAENLWHSPSLGSGPLQFLTLPEDLCGVKGKRLVKKQLEPLIPDLVAGDIAGLLGGDTRIGARSVRAGDIAVLVRTNTQAAEIQAALRSRGINGVLQSKASVWGSTEAQECLRLLAAVAEPGNEQLLRKALATTMLGFSGNDLDRLNQAESELYARMGRAAAWQEVWQKNGVMRMLLAVWQEHGVTGRLLLFEDGERRLTNLRHLAELLQDTESRNHFSPEMLVDWLSQTLSAGESGEEAELRLESDEDAVQLVTIHRSKGLEYPIVYCPYLCLGGSGTSKQPFVSLHDPKADWQGRIVLFPDEAARALAAGERFAEELRLAYVAMTRARHSCHILWAPVSGYDSSGLAWLLHGDQAEPEAAGSPEGLQEQLKGCTGPELLARLQARAKASEGWQVRQLQPGTAATGEAAKPTAPAELTCRTAVRKQAQVWRIGSFSHLTAQSSHDPGEMEPEGAAEEGTVSEQVVEISPVALISLAQFPKGPVAGNFFHTLFELTSFPQENPALLRELVREQLRFYGYPEQQWLAPVCRAFAEVLKTPLCATDSFCLGDLPDGQRLNEMPFTFPVGAGLGEEASLSAELLARPFIDHPQGIPAGYVESLRALRFIPLRGFLKGFIDLVCVVNGKWYLLDYKSNHLGDSRDDYAREKLPAAMAHHHYFLQYHIYTVALHRYLSCRLPGYVYERDFGGVFYLFFKGMHPDFGSEFGVFADLPPLARIEQLSEIFQSLAGEGL
ncbi:exodeoxyribonuclease V subunit beta [Thiovibrio frasassiensis]|uniref:DNA 3'-5' helicase n=1 Tax=Thiovibrio frasassiensis TaxID=2984131 RepID=A0A9X4MJ25_9BACT|nr:exodeoxyribonuclease V subunit beta [Thiovibrio frasassiensis]MDG4476860.1 exodeoxyribonuclease V subunit beta [Thiovibrio frasassiensis]